MSLQARHIQCHGCDFQGIIQPRPITLRYILPDENIVERHRAFGWCSACSLIRDVEAPLDANEIRKELEIQSLKQVPASRLKSAIDRILGINPHEDQVELQQLEKLLRLAEIRRSPPRCLTCGETTVTHLHFDNEGTSSFTHSCGSRLFQVSADPDTPRFSYRPEVILLNIEGQRI